MPFALVWLEESADTFDELQEAALKSLENRWKSKKAKASKQEGLFKQVVKCVELLEANPRHPGLKTHEYKSIENPYDPDTKVFERTFRTARPAPTTSYGAMAQRRARLQSSPSRRFRERVHGRVVLGRTCKKSV